eukprot:6142795-Pyramimonas_sp.AAC.1
MATRGARRRGREVKAEKNVEHARPGTDNGPVDQSEDSSAPARWQWGQKEFEQRSLGRHS